MPGQLRQACALMTPPSVVGAAPVPGAACTRFIVPVTPSETLLESTVPWTSGPTNSPFSLTIGAVVEKPSSVLRPV